MPVSNLEVLLIEDNPDDAELAIQAFKQAPTAARVVVAASASAALQYLEDDSHRLPALILLDLKLPDMHGTEVLRAIRSSPRAQLVPVVVLSTSRERRDVVDSYRFGANGYIVKPVDFAHFASVVSQASGYWLIINESPLPRDEHARSTGS